VLTRPGTKGSRELGTKIRGCTFVHFEQRFPLNGIGFAVSLRFRDL
jgi:hypothetical protein